MLSATYLELWSDFACKGGARQAYVQAPISARESRSVRTEESLSASLSILDAAYPSLIPRRVLRVTYPGGGFDEWRVDAVTETRASDNKITVETRCLPPLFDLGTVSLVQRTESDGSVAFEFDFLQLTPSEILAQLITAHPDLGWVGIGTVDIVSPVDLTISWDTPLSALRRLAEVTNCELQLRRNGTTNYLLDLVIQVGASANPLDCRYGKNLVAALRERSGPELATRVYGKGAPLDDNIFTTLNQNRWVAGAASGSDIPLSDPAGGSGPILVDDQLNGLYVDKLDGTTPVLITDCVASTQKVTLASVAGFVTGQLVRICKDAAGAPVTYLEHPIYKQAPPTGYGLKVGICERQDIAGAVNLIGNPSMRSYAGASAAPDTWVKLGNPTLTRTSAAARWLSGGFSCRIQGTADGDGIETGYATLRPTATLPYFSGYFVYWVEAGQLRVELIAAKAALSVSSITRSGTTVTVTTAAPHGLSAGQLAELVGATQTEYNGIQAVTSVPTTTTFTYEISTTPTTPATGTITWAQVWRIPGFGDTAATSSGTQSWDNLGVAGQDLNALGAVRAKLRIVQHGSTALDAYPDAAQLTQTAGFEEYIEGAGPTRLWQAANVKLSDQSQPLERYEGSVLDVQGIDPTTWTFETITLGQAVNVRDEVLGLTRTVRLLEYERNLLTQEVFKVTLGTEFPSFTRDLFPQRLPRRQQKDGIVDTALIASSRLDPIPESPGVLRMLLAANVPGAQLYYWFGDVYDLPPNTGSTQAGAPNATTWGTYTGPVTISQDQAKDVQLAIFARLGTRVSLVIATTLDTDSYPRITGFTAAEITGPKAHYAWTVDDDVRWVRIYSNVGSWPVATRSLTITRSGATATATTSSAHHLKTGDLVTVTGATQTEYNVTDASVTVVDATHFTYAVTGTPATPATGTPVMRSCRGVLDETKHKVELAVNPDGGGRTSTGGNVAGGTTYDDGTFSSSDQVYAIAVPIDFRDNPGRPEDRRGLKITIAAAVSPQITGISASRTNDGSACDTTSGAEYTFSWTSTGLTDGTHKVVIIAESWSTTDTTPVASPSNTVRVPFQVTTGKWDGPVTIHLSWQLLDGSDAVIQSGTLDPDTFITSCPL